MFVNAHSRFHVEEIFPRLWFSCCRLALVLGSTFVVCPCPLHFTVLACSAAPMCVGVLGEGQMYLCGVGDSLRLRHALRLSKRPMEAGAIPVLIFKG